MENILNVHFFIGQNADTELFRLQSDRQDQLRHQLLVVVLTLGHPEQLGGRGGDGDHLQLVQVQLLVAVQTLERRCNLDENLCPTKRQKREYFTRFSL